MKLLTFNEWLNEDFDGSFAQVGVAPNGNVNGMGAPVPPNSGAEGSGDAWPSLGKPYSLVSFLTKRKRRRKKNSNRAKQ